MSAIEALQWMKSKASNNDHRVLFRGQNKVWPSVRPSITRDDEQTRTEMWTVCRWFHTAAAGVTGYSIPLEHDRLAILQHYIGRSPVIDLTATPEIALYFALLGANPGSECVVYSVDRAASTPQVAVFSDHSFLTLPLKDGGLKHRWLRQDGYSVGPAEWRDTDAVYKFDLLQLPGVESARFTKDSEDDQLISHLGDLEDTASDPLALAVRGVVTSLVRSLNLTSPGLEKLLRASRTRDPDAELASDIDSLISLTASIDAPAKLVAELQTLRSAVGQSYWDISFDCSLDWARREVSRLAPPATEMQYSKRETA